MPASPLCCVRRHVITAADGRAGGSGGPVPSPRAERLFRTSSYRLSLLLVLTARLYQPLAPREKMGEEQRSPDSGENREMCGNLSHFPVPAHCIGAGTQSARPFEFVFYARASRITGNDPAVPAVGASGRRVRFSHPSSAGPLPGVPHRVGAGGLDRSPAAAARARPSPRPPPPPAGTSGHP